MAALRRRGPCNALRRSAIDTYTAADGLADPSKNDSRDDARVEALKAWLQPIDGLAGAELTPASGDASFRRYFRLRPAAESCRGQSFIAMDAPPAQEDCRPFVRVAEYLQSMDLNAPRVLQAELGQGFLLLSDLGDRQYLDELNRDPAIADVLYHDAIDALVRLQQKGVEFQPHLPPYDARLLGVELSLFRDCLCETHLGLEFSPTDEKSWNETCALLVRNALEQPRVFVHRDYHSRNLMRDERQNPGILDFQDAVEGPLTYDLVSLLKDCYVRWPDEQVQTYLEYFYGKLTSAVRQNIDATLFRRYFDLMGVQRHLKAAGIFARLNHRDSKPDYLGDVPRTLSYVVDLAPRYPELNYLLELIASRLLPGFGDTA